MNAQESSNSGQTEEVIYDEDVVEAWNKGKDDSIVASYVENYSLGYDGEGPGGVRYSPYKHANTCIGFEQQGFYIYYSFPNGSRTPVASFWTVSGYKPSGEKIFKFIHIDLGKVTEDIVNYYKNRGHLPPPKRDSAKQDSH